MIVYTFSFPGDSLPFYVGKRRPGRPYEHFKHSNLVHHKTHFYLKLHNLLARGIYPKIKIVANGLTNQQAIDLEIKLIQIYSRQDAKTGCLCNHTDGGEGGVGGHSCLGREVSIEERIAKSKSKSERGKKNIREGSRRYH